VRLLILDLAPALLSWEGREETDEPEVADGALQALEHLYARYRLAAIADGDRPGSELRWSLERAGLGGFFESVGTSADFGPAVSPQVIRRIASTVGAIATSVLVVTARSAIAETLGRNGIATMVLGPEGIAGLPEQLRMGAGPLNP
jgi:hypothetical protein